MVPGATVMGCKGLERKNPGLDLMQILLQRVLDRVCVYILGRNR